MEINMENPVTKPKVRLPILQLSSPAQEHFSPLLFIITVSLQFQSASSVLRGKQPVSLLTPFNFPVRGWLSCTRGCSTAQRQVQAPSRTLWAFWFCSASLRSKVASRAALKNSPNSSLPSLGSITWEWTPTATTGASAVVKPSLAPASRQEV